MDECLAYEKNNHIFVTKHKRFFSHQLSSLSGFCFENNEGIHQLEAHSVFETQSFERLFRDKCVKQLPK